MLGLDASCSSASPRQLSGGQRQRVAMGRAIVREPSVFLMDEPLSNLDAKLRVQMRARDRALQQRLGATTVYVTHDQVEAMTLGNRVAVLQGRRRCSRRAAAGALRAPRRTLRRAPSSGRPPMNLVTVPVGPNGNRFARRRRAVPYPTRRSAGGHLGWQQPCGRGRPPAWGTRPGARAAPRPWSKWSKKPGADAYVFCAAELADGPQKLVARVIGGHAAVRSAATTSPSVPGQGRRTSSMWTQEFDSAMAWSAAADERAGGRPRRRQLALGAGSELVEQGAEALGDDLLLALHQGLRRVCRTRRRRRPAARSRRATGSQHAEEAGLGPQRPGQAAATVPVASAARLARRLRGRSRHPTALLPTLTTWGHLGLVPRRDRVMVQPKGPTTAARMPMRSSLPRLLHRPSGPVAWCRVRRHARDPLARAEHEPGGRRPAQPLAAREQDEVRAGVAGERPERRYRRELRGRVHDHRHVALVSHHAPQGRAAASPRPGACPPPREHGGRPRADRRSQLVLGGAVGPVADLDHAPARQLDRRVVRAAVSSVDDELPRRGRQDR